MTNIPLLSFHADVPNWVLLAIGAGIFLLVLLAIVLSLRARRNRAAPLPEPAFAWGDAPPLTEPIVTSEPGFDQVAFPEQAPDPMAAPLDPEPAPAAAAGGQIHYCRCPACQTQFTVNGMKPIVTNCPGCGKKGYLR